MYIGPRNGNGDGDNPPRSWPELIGVDAEEAKAQILKDDPNLKVIVVPPGNMAVTMDYRPDRVRIFTAEGGKVSRAPSTG